MGEWRFLLDENIDPKTATYLEKEGTRAEHVRDTLGQGAEDKADILPYVAEHDLVFVTSDVTDFGPLPRSGSPPEHRDDASESIGRHIPLETGGFGMVLSP